MPLNQYDYILAFGVIFAFLDAFQIGANDVANSFATSVSSKSLTFKQALAIASVAEALGAILLGSRVADTIRSKIISVNMFERDPSVLMLGMMCALVGSSIWLTIATHNRWTVSTTHSIVGAVIGVGIAANGTGGVQWGFKGVAGIIASWLIAPCLAGSLAATAFTLQKYGVLRRKNSLRIGMALSPIWFCITIGVLTLVIVYKGSPALKLDDLSTTTMIAAVFGVVGVTLLFCLFFFLPFVYRRLIVEDWQLRWYHMALGPFVLRRGSVPPIPDNVTFVKNYSHKGDFDQLQTASETSSTKNADIEKDFQTKDGSAESEVEGRSRESSAITVAPIIGGPTTSQSGARTLAEDVQTDAGGRWYLSPRLVGRKVWDFFTYGVRVDILAEQNKHEDSRKMHAVVVEYDNKTEHLYSFLQVLTATTMSTAHGANDVSNAIGPLATIYLVWRTNTIASSAPVPIWILVFGGLSISIGLAMFGYRIMSILGNRLTPHSPSRGFSIELGAALTVIIATRYGFPVSSTQSAAGATIGVGLCSGDWRAVNWKLFGYFILGWVLTLPIAGSISGCLFAFIINAPGNRF